jgi:hypothetical protein
MKEFITNFTAREAASIVWITIIFFATLFNQGLRKSYWDIQKTLFSKPLVIIGCTFFVYTFFEAYFLQKVGFWVKGSQKDVIFWVLLSAFPSITLFDKVEDSKFLSTYLKPLFGFTVLVEFVNSSYTYSFFCEFFLVLPVITFLALIIAFSEKAAKSDWTSVLVQKILIWVFIFAGFIIAFNSFKLFYEDLDNISFKGILIELLAPIILSIGFLPFLYCLSIYLKLASIYSPLKNFVKVQAPSLLMLKIFWKLNFNFELVEKWKDRILRFNLKSHEKLIFETFNLKKDIYFQNTNKYLPLNEGWGIESSKYFLSKFQLSTGDYKQEDVDSRNWYACSPPLYIGEAIINNNLAYYLDGFCDKVTELKVIANFHNVKFAIETKELFTESVITLVYESMFIKLPETVFYQIQLEEDFELILLDKKIGFMKTVWTNGIGYHLSFIVSNS